MLGQSAENAVGLGWGSGSRGTIYKDIDLNTGTDKELPVWMVNVSRCSEETNTSFICEHYYGAYMREERNPDKPRISEQHCGTRWPRTSRKRERERKREKERERPEIWKCPTNTPFCENCGRSQPRGPACAGAPCLQVELNSTE